MSAARLDLDPPYQRRSVWNLEYKQFFIDSLIRNYPAPSVFLQVDLSPDRPTVYRVIDGKQRLSALAEFQRDEFPTPDSLANIGLADLYYSQLPGDVKVNLLEYVFTVENIKNASPAELNEAFDRLNRNVARLNKQELRHARYGGAFIKKVEGLAEHPFWVEVGLSTPARIRRMLDVEYVSELYIISMDGTQEGKDYLDRFYAENDREIKNEEEADRRFTRAQDILRDVSRALPLRSTRYSNVADFYSLWAAIHVLDDGNVDSIEISERLQKFVGELEEEETRRARTYKTAAVQGSNKKSNRDVRVDTLVDVLTGE